MRRLYLFLLVLLLTGCQAAAASAPAALPSRVAVATPPALTPSPFPLPSSTVAELPATHTPAPPPTVSPTATARPSATPSPTATPDPYAGLTIAALAARSYGGGLLEIVDTLEENEEFARYLIRYPSDGLLVYGFLSVPNEGARFPVALVLHGYIDPDVYEVETYTTRYADALVRAGYFVIHPNYRNYPPSDTGPNPYRIGYASDVLNLIGIIREQSQDAFGPLRRADATQIHLMGHSMGGGTALRVATVWPEAVDAVVLYAAMSGDEARNYARIAVWSDGEDGAFELAAAPAMLSAISPIYHLDRLRAAISIHHSTADTVVPYEWSEQLCTLLADRSLPLECFTYYATPHTFRGSAETLFIERMIAFFDRY